MTLLWSELRADSIARLSAAGIDGPDQELRWIIERASGRTPAEQVLALDTTATDREVGLVEVMVARRAAGEPLQYVIGRWGFRTLDLLVDRRVLIPRPETEVVAGLAIEELARLGRRSLAVDLGTGSGAIALSLAAECWPDIEVWATDKSSDALAVARANLAALGRRATSVRLVEGDWFGALPDELRGRIDVIVSNPPYVATTDALPCAVTDWEPGEALYAGADGLDEIRLIVAGAPVWLAPDGVLVVEIGESQGDAVRRLALDAGFADAAIHHDLAARDRALVARWRTHDQVRRPTVISLRDAHDVATVVDRIAAALRSGGVVLLPTDTVYGLAALPKDAAVIEQLFALKGRDTATPLAVLCADVDQAIGLADRSVGAAVAAVGARWWPGPLTLVVPRRPGVDLHLGEPATTIGLRVPDHDLIRAVAAAVGPIAATSANRHGEPTPTTAAAAAQQLGSGIAVVVDGGELSVGASTVVDATHAPWTVLREGPIPGADVVRVSDASQDHDR